PWAAHGHVNADRRAGEHRASSPAAGPDRGGAGASLTGVEHMSLVVGIGVLGLFVGASAALAFRFSEVAQRSEKPAESPAGTVSEEAAALLSAFRSPSGLLGPHGEGPRRAPGSPR